MNSDRLCVVIPLSLQIPAVRWMHSLLMHPGIEKLYSTMARNFWFPRMKTSITQFTNQCEICQRYKSINRKHGFLPTKNILFSNPWDQVDVDLIGPWKITIKGIEYVFRALTCIDPIINIAEIIPIENASANVTAVAFENEWLSRYPRPIVCAHDNGNEFLGKEFQNMLHKNGIKSQPTTIKNPQANSTVERLHQNISSMIAMSLQENHTQQCH